MTNDNENETENEKQINRYDDYMSPVIQQISESQNGGIKKTKQAKFPEKRTFYTH